MSYEQEHYFRILSTFPCYPFFCIGTIKVVSQIEGGKKRESCRTGMMPEVFRPLVDGKHTHSPLR